MYNEKVPDSEHPQTWAKVLCLGSTTYYNTSEQLHSHP